MTASTGQSPRKLEPKLALVLMPASVALCSLALAMTFGHRAISCICVREAIALTPIITHLLLYGKGDGSHLPLARTGHRAGSSARHSNRTWCIIAVSAIPPKVPQPLHPPALGRG